jgi:hypothetical protein
MKKPYIRKIGKFSGYDVFYVDGIWVRKNLEREFTTYADHIKYNFIPKKEFWIEEEFAKKEWKYYVKYFIAKIKYLQEGNDLKKSIFLANIIEQKERDKSKIIQKLKKSTKEEQIKSIHKKFLKEYSNDSIKVWIVKGFLVRSLYFLDFSSGGHDKVYTFIPKNEIWIDDSMNPSDIKYLLIHELHERYHMNQGLYYDFENQKSNDAHALAHKLEEECRNSPEKVDYVLKQEIKNNS